MPEGTWSESCRRNDEIVPDSALQVRAAFVHHHTCCSEVRSAVCVPRERRDVRERAATGRQIAVGERAVPHSEPFVIYRLGVNGAFGVASWSRCDAERFWKKN